MPAPLALELEGPVTDGFRSVMTFLPKLLGFLVLLLVGYVVAKIVAKLVDRLLERVGFDRAVERGPVQKALAHSPYDASDVVAKLVFFALFLPFLSAAVGALGIAALQEPLADFIALLPKIVVAIVLVVVGAMLAGVAKSFLRNTLGGLSYRNLLANAAAVLILFGFVKAALDQVGIATQVTGALLYAMLAAAAGVVIVGVGGGLIKPMQSRWETMLSKADQEKDNIRNTARMNNSRDAYPADPAPEPSSTRSSGMDAPTATYGMRRP
jgi:hypothetical protein